MRFERIIDYIEYWALNESNHIALIYKGHSITYQNLYEKARRYASLLLDLGIMPGERIAYLNNCCPDFFYLYLGASLIGAAICAIDPRTPNVKVNQYLAAVEAKILISSLARINILTIIRDDQLKVVSLESLYNQEPSNNDSKLELYRDSVTDGTPVFIVFTSGTTGQPKGAILTQKSIITAVGAQIREFGAPVGLGIDDIIQHHVPVCHVSGAVQWGVAPLIAGSTMILHESFDAESVLRNTEQYGATILTGVPSMWEMFFRLDSFSKYNLSSVRWCATGAAPINRSLAEKIFSITDNVSNPLGMTETSGFCSMFQGNTSLDKVISTVGRIIPELDYHIFNDGIKVGTNTIGQLAYKGSSIIPGYLNLDLPTVSDGYFLTNDLAFEDDEGYIHMCGRKDDMFIVGGHNVFPEEIERTILNYENIGNAIVVPIQHTTMGNVCKAIVTRSMKDSPIDLAGLKRYLDNHLESYKIPREIEIVDCLPKSGLGKINRRTFMQS